MERKQVIADERALADFVEATLGDSGPATPPRRIVAAFAGDEQASSVLAWTEALARINDANVTVVRAYGHLPTTVFLPDAAAIPIPSPAQLAKEREGAAFETELAREQLGKAGLQPQVRIVEGSPVDVILREAKVERSDIVVLGGVPRGPIARLAEPSVASTIVARGDRPILLARGPFRAEHILIAADGSAPSAAAVRTGFMLAKAWGSLVSVIHVNAGDISWPMTHEPHRVQLGGYLPAAYVVVGGLPAEKIPEYAREHGIDLIVTGARADRRVGPFFKPSVSRKIVKRSAPSVLIIRSKPDRSSGAFEKDD